MGHHAQYAKRGSHSPAYGWPLPPPIGGDVEGEIVDRAVRIKILAEWPPGAGAMRFRYRPVDGAWEAGPSITVREQFFAVTPELDPGWYELGGAWAAFPSFDQLSDYFSFTFEIV
jgi:hypothetical protein